MEAETMVSSSPIVTSAVSRFRKNSQKKSSISGSIPTLVESVVFENPTEDDDEKSEREDDFVEVGSAPVSTGNGSRRNSFGFMPKPRKTSLSFSSFLGIKSKSDRVQIGDGTYSRNDEFSITNAPLPPRRSSIAVVPNNEDRTRRTSWGTKLQSERKRRQSGGDATGDDNSASSEEKGKRRSSWWNSIVPENVLKTRSRRSSQQLSRSDESITQIPYRRSKSRSVDHSFAAPFDLDSLRSKVEGRFDAVQKDDDETAKRIPSVPPKKTTKYIVRDGDTLTFLAARFDTTPSELTKLNRLGTNFIFPGQNLLVPDKSDDDDESIKRIIPPKKTVKYVIRDGDTLTSLAARFDTTPSELTKLNRLGTNFIFPGQNLLVPDKSDDESKDGDAPSESGEAGSDTSSQAIPSQEKDILDTLRPVSPELPASPAAPQRFLKINVRHITDGQGVVSGVLLVTPNAVMFDPNVSDPLVLEHGPESYGVIAPMEFVVNAAIYYDIAHMRTHDSNPNIIRGEKPEIYYMNKSNSPGKDSLVKDETFPELANTTADGDLPEWTDQLGGRASGDIDDGVTASSDSGERGGDAFPKAFDRELVTPTSAQQTTEERRRSLLDHHWAVPNKERMSIDITSEVSSASMDHSREEDLQNLNPNLLPQQAAELPALHLVKLSCHDSGIDIREPLPNVTPCNAKKVYSDADIVLSQDWIPPVSIMPASDPPLSAPPMSSEERVKKQAAVSFSLDSNIVNSSDTSKDDSSKTEKKNKMLKRLSYPLSWMEGLAGDTTTGTGAGSSSGSQGDSLPTSADSHNSGNVFYKVFSSSPMNLVELGTGLFLSKTPSEEGTHDPLFPQSGRSSYGGFGKPDNKKVPNNPPPRLDYRSMVSVDDKPELFRSLDKIIPRPACSCDDPPLYLRLRMGRPMNKSVPRSTPLMSYGRKRMRPEYWFSVPRNRVDDLYKFLNHWVPELYGELGDVSERGYILVDSDTELSDDESGTSGVKGERSDSQGDMGDLTRESWEVLSMSDELRRALYISGASVDMEFNPPDLIGTSEIFTLEHREKLCVHLPARAQGYMWSLVFSSSQHGFSLNSVYRKMQRVDSPILLVVRDTDNNVFGALTSCALHPSEHFYGTGESFLFSFCATRPHSPPSHVPIASAIPNVPTPNTTTITNITKEGEETKSDSSTKAFRVWQWTGDNLYFIRGSNDNISIGAGDGKFGLWLDGDLYQGRTQSCTTYGNEPLSTQEDFIVKTLECWAFI